MENHELIRAAVELLKDQVRIVDAQVAEVLSLLDVAPAETPPVGEPPVEEPAPNPVARVDLYPSTCVLVEGQGKMLIALAKDSAGNTLPAAGLTYAWSSSDPKVAEVEGRTAAGVVSARAAGTAYVTVSVNGVEAAACYFLVSATEVAPPAEEPSPVEAPPVEEPAPVEPPPAEPPVPPAVIIDPAPPSAVVAAPPEFPRKLVDTSMPVLSGRVLYVKSGEDLQGAVASALPGDVVELEAGATWRGPLTLTRRADGGTVVIRSSRWAELPEGVRVTPEDAPKLARIVGGAANRRTVQTAEGAEGYRFIGIEVGLEAEGVPAVVNMLVELELSSKRIIWDRCYVHGNAMQNLTRGITLNNADSAIINSTVAECHRQGFDAQAILGYRGPGPFLIENNRLEGSGENIMFGGAALGPDGLEPSDIVIRGNHVIKPLEWKGIWTAKNLLELKIAERVLIENNVLENVWASAQVGFAINLKSENRNMDTYPDAATRDVLVRNNEIKNARYGVTVIGGASTQDHTGTGRTSRVRIENNHFDFAAEEQYPRAFQYAGVVDLAIVGNSARRGRVLESGSVLRDLSKAQGAYLADNDFGGGE